MLDQQDLLSAWWKQLPGYVDQVQHLVDQVQNTVEEVAVRRESLRQVLNKAENAG
jgi:ABC-type transporter Mla subunit MlaD